MAMNSLDADRDLIFLFGEDFGCDSGQFLFVPI
jgi:hypothetical protein